MSSLRPVSNRLSDRTCTCTEMAVSLRNSWYCFYYVYRNFPRSVNNTNNVRPSTVRYQKAGNSLTL